MASAPSSPCQSRRISLAAQAAAASAVYHFQSPGGAWEMFCWALIISAACWHFALLAGSKVMSALRPHMLRK